MDFAHLPLSGAGSLFDALTNVPDPRSRSGLRYPAKALLAAAICACLAGENSFKGIAEWLADLSFEKRNILGFKRKNSPSEKTIRTFLKSVDPDKMATTVGSWLQKQIQAWQSKALAID